MYRKKAIQFGILFALVIIAFKLSIYLTGNQNTTLGKFSHLISLALFIPFSLAYVKWIRDSDFEGIIGGKVAIRENLKYVIISILILSIFNYFFYEYAIKNVLIGMIREMDPQFIVDEGKKGGKIITLEQAKLMIASDEQGISAFKDTTIKIMGMLFFGVLSSFVASAYLRRG